MVRLNLPEGSAPPVVAFHDKTYKLFPESGDNTHQMYRALIALAANLPAGAYPLSCGDWKQIVHVGSGGFGIQKLRLPSDKDNFIASPGEEEAVDQAKSTLSEAQLWTGKFVRPSDARITTRYGLRRMVNGHLLQDYFHSGIDYAGALGSPVKAAQRGRVVLAHQGNWRLHGNVIAIDHGQGVISFYIHLSKVLVKPGQLVNAGDVIGKVGATGRANGPHLHFSVYVNKDAANPVDWFTRTI